MFLNEGCTIYKSIINLRDLVHNEGTVLRITIRDVATIWEREGSRIVENVIICLPVALALLRLLKDAIRSGEQRASSGRSPRIPVIYYPEERIRFCAGQKARSLNTQPIK